jgi:hypothetical protein
MPKTISSQYLSSAYYVSTTGVLEDEFPFISDSMKLVKVDSLVLSFSVFFFLPFVHRQTNLLLLEGKNWWIPFE